MRIINKKYLLVILLVGIILTGVIILKPNKEVQLDDVILKQEVNNKTMAMYVGRDNNYEEYEGNSFPKGYRLNQEKSKCIDNNGAEINNVLKEENGSVSLTTNKSSYCYLYFDEKENLSNICNGSTMQECMSNPDKLNKIKTVESLSNDIVGDMYRYQGTDNVSNWICFGTENNCSTTENDIDKYMYRIIGITPTGELKIIKETFIKEDDVKTFQWNDKVLTADCGDNGEKCTWPDSVIFKRLNGISNGNVKGTDGNSNIFIGNSYYDYLNNGTWLDMIEERLWKYGNIHNDSFNGNEVYNLENKFTTDNTTLGTAPKGKIGLMYLHDYLYAYKTNESDAGNPQSAVNAKNAWIYRDKDGFNSLPDFEWLMIPRPPQDAGAGMYVPGNGIASNGSVTDNAIVNGHYLGVRPTIYIESSIKLSGLGTIDNPYIIN